MKKIIFITLIAAPLLLTGFHGSKAAFGACEGRGGVNCLAGPALFGYAQCYDNSTSSVLYSQAMECANDSSTGCVSPVIKGCISSSQVQDLQSRLDKYTKECELLYTPSVQYYTGCSFPSLQRQIQICNQEIQDYQADQQVYGSCIRNYYQVILENTSTTLSAQLKIQKQSCSLKQGYVWDNANNICVNMAPVAISSSSITANSSIPLKYDLKTNLGIGTSGSDVAVLQKFLQDKNFLKMPAGINPGYFGSLTKKALGDFQRTAGLPATGYCGVLTRAIINNSN